MRPYRLSPAPRALRRRNVKLDNVALLPASQLPFKEHWQAIANELPAGSVLVYLPKQEKQRRIVRCVTSHMRDQGRSVHVIG